MDQVRKANAIAAAQKARTNTGKLSDMARKHPTLPGNIPAGLSTTAPTTNLRDLMERETKKGASDMLDPESIRRFSLVALEIEGVVLNILLFMRLCRGEIKSIFGSSRRRKKSNK